MTSLKVIVKCGTVTCAPKDTGRLCSMTGTIKFGTTWVCRLFPTNNDAHTLLESDSNNWLLRCDACIKAEKAGFIL